jgi:Zn-finger nucleic acid-binding protein
VKCPIDASTLVMSNREGIEIDYCPQCRGVWLDRGELDKIVERSTSTQSEPIYGRDDRGNHDRAGRHGHSDEHSSHNDQKKRSRESWLGELFG